MAVSGVISHKNVTNAVWYSLVQLRSLRASGHWLLARGLLTLVVHLFISQKREASSKKPKINTVYRELLAPYSIGW
ncbi:MAG: hypothetical protein PVG40_14510, partial [Desulfobacterales bacterium]